MEIFLNLHTEQLDLAAILPTLPARRRQQAMQYRRLEDKCSSVAAWLLLREACQRVLGTEDVPEVGIGKTGNPFLVHVPDFYFNLSHTDGAAACAVSRIGAVGIDIERVKPLDREVMQQVMNEAEQQQILRAERPDVEFTRLWTQKESLLKCTAEGLTAIHTLPALLTQSTGFRIESHLTDDYRFAYSVCQETKLSV